MSLDWSNERYVRLYTRDTAEQLCWPWQARAIWPLLLRKADRSGMLPVSSRLGVRGIAALISIPVEVVEPGMEALLEDGCVRAAEGGGYVIPNYLDAQEAPASDAKRQRDLRERRRKAATSENHDDACHGPSRTVTDRHATSRPVTPSLADPSLADPIQVPEQTLAGLPRAHARSVDTGTAPLELVPQSPPAPKPARRTKAPRIALPDDWAPCAASYALGRSLGLGASVVDDEAGAMRDWARSKGETKADWDATLNGFIRRRAKEGPGPRPPPPRTPGPGIGYAPARADSHRTPDGIQRIDTEF